MILHGLDVVDAATVIIQVIRRAHTDNKTHAVNELGLRKEWTKYAQQAGIEIEEDEARREAEKQRAISQAMRDFGM